MQDIATTRKKATIVIVDDEQSILKELKILLGRMYKVHVFANPEEAEDFVDNHEVDLVISDEMMPEMRGSELLAKIHSKHPDICNIVLSGQAEKDDIVRAVNEGHLFSFLYKPTERQQLLNVIEKGLENRNMKIQLAQQNIQLKEYSENLEKMVEEKTAELVKAYDRLNMLDANKMYFLIYLSEEMDSSLDRIQKLAEELLAYFAFSASELQLNMVPVSLNQVVDSVVQGMRADFDRAGIALDVNVDTDAQVMAEPDYLARVIGAMAKNALVFSEAGGHVRITGGPIEERIRLCISDTGKGIARDNLKKLFIPFVISREDRHPEGFGLNMPMAKNIINAFAGKIWAESEGPGTGARFCVELNRAE
ncbi:MAG: hybrid sensor histidine kinase/response regulator [Desulfobulbaceae bacterium]|nr:hybrid sensor histidine kinase/response regulator [Desulfobulbaceae bacterium]